MGDYFSIESGNGRFISKAAALVESGQYQLAFIALDISNFKYINDFYGMPEGDKVMERIETFFFREEPLCLAAYGMGFDQFRGIFDMTGKSEGELITYLTEKSQKFEDELAKSYPLVYNHVYIGIYFYEDTDVDVRIAIDRSNLAKKDIKNNFNVNCRVFRDNNWKEHLENMHMSNLFMHALQNDQIELYIQPKVSASRSCVIGGEALVRMRDDAGNIIMPGSFVPTLEKIGLVNRLDKVMIEKVFAFQRKCLDEGKNLYPISINVSKQEFTSVQFADSIMKLNEKYRIEPKFIEFELVESSFVNNLSSIVETISRLREGGFQISVDDFGAGYSSLNQIANIPADTIKLDGMFARESLKTQKGRTVIQALITMLYNINYDIVFEGVENQEQLELVTNYGCDTIQGFYYSRPIEAKTFVSKYGENATIDNK